MAELAVNRSIQFVSLDTHPANNALVLTYEVLVSVLEPSPPGNQQQPLVELARRSKRDQLLIGIGALDALNEQDLRDGKLAIDLEQLSVEIVRRCPLLLSQNHNYLEDIQLHLLYLINRRQSQLLAASREPPRPPSAASARLRSARHLSAGSAKTGKSLGIDKRQQVAHDVYTYLRARETNGDDFWHSERELFVGQLDEHLCLLEDPLERLSGNKEVIITQLDTYLEGLYGEAGERLVSMMAIRRLCKTDESLAAMSSNKLLVCAMVRTLRDCREMNLRESILYCLIRLTCFGDIHERLFEDSSSSIDLIKMISDMLAEQVRVLQVATQELPERYFCVGASLAITLNLLELRKIGGEQHSSVERRVLSQPEQPMVDALVELLQVISRYLAVTDVQLLAKPEYLLRLLTFTLAVLRYLSIFKEFIVHIRKQRNFHDSLISLLNTLQLARSNTGEESPDTATNLNRDKQLLNELYRVELDLLRLINNLLFERGLKLRLLKRNLLKCVLRNLVLYLASRQSSKSLAPFEQSSVLMVPLKALYELSCELEVRKELCKSRIIMKCLLEYLLSASNDLLLSLQQQQQAVVSSGEPHNSSAEEPSDQMVLEPDCASHFILALWLNLSAFEWPEALDESQVREYVDLSMVIARTLAFSRTQQSRAHMLHVYLHLKLVRSLIQFWPASGTNQQVVADAARWSHSLTELADRLLATSDGGQHSAVLSTECLATLSNLIRRPSAIEATASAVATSVSADNRKLPLEAPNATGSLLARLFQLESSSSLAATENDDLLLASVTFVGSLASKCEICALIRGDNEEEDDYDDEKGEDAEGTGKVVEQLHQHQQQRRRHRRRLPISSQIISASNFILSSRTSDRQMIVCSLCTLGQLSKHLAFLGELRAQQQQQEVAAAAVSSLKSLVDKLAGLMLNGTAEQPLVELSVCLLSRLRQLEVMVADESWPTDDAGKPMVGGGSGAEPAVTPLTCERRQLVYKKRFAGYNGKWLAAIRLSRRVDDGDDCSGTGRGVDGGGSGVGNVAVDDMIDGAHSSLFAAEEHDFAGSTVDVETEEEGDDDLDQVRAFEEPRASGGSSLGAASGESCKDEEEVEEGDEYADEDDDDDDDDEDDDEDDVEEEDDEALEAPDLNVIDANSMIKHLTSRRGFRSDWLSSATTAGAASTSPGTGRGGS